MVKAVGMIESEFEEDSLREIWVGGKIISL